MADGGAPDPRARLIPWDSCDYDPGNPRRSSPDEVLDLSDLAGPIRAHGILAPLLVERRGDRYLIDDGERRHRTAGQVGRTEDVPVIVLDDLDAEARLELQLASYARAPMGPLAEGRAYKRLLDTFSPGMPITPGDIADRLGKPTSHVRQRLALLTLSADAQALLAAGKITLGLALGGNGQPGLVALSPDAQVRAIVRLPVAGPGEEPIGLRAGVFAIRGELLSLDSAPWELADATHPGGACTTCPKRTGAQLALLGENVERDECTDRACHDRKASAWRERRDDAEAERTVGPEKAKKGREAKGDAFKPAASRAPEPPGEVTPQGSGSERSKAARKASIDEIERTLGRLADAIDERGLDTPTLASLVVRVVSGAALFTVAERRRLGTSAPRKAILASIKAFEDDNEIERIDALVGELLAAHDADTTAPDDDSAYNLALRWLGPEKPAERVKGKSKAKPDPLAIACPVAGCEVPAGKPCVNYKGKPCAPQMVG